MTKIHTHYDNLKVARNAPPEVIRAAYKTLSQKYHPDRHPGSAEAARITKIINTSFDALNDPVKRREHDEWIAHEESTTATGADTTRPQSRPDSPGVDRNRPAVLVWDGVLARTGYVVRHVATHRRRYVIAAIILFALYATYVAPPSAPPPGPKPYTRATPVAAARALEYVRPVIAPNGLPWPSTAAYLPGFSHLSSDGHSTLKVNNSQNGADVFAKLVSVSGPKAYPVRVFFIPANGTFTLTQLTPDTYDVRYRDLITGELRRTESFNLTEKPVYEGGKSGVEYTTLTFSLYKVRDGNAQTYPLADSEF